MIVKRLVYFIGEISVAGLSDIEEQLLAFGNITFLHESLFLRNKKRWETHSIFFDFELDCSLLISVHLTYARVGTGET